MMSEKYDMDYVLTGRYFFVYYNYLRRSCHGQSIRQTDGVF